MKHVDCKKISGNLERLSVLTEIYNDLSKQEYPSRSEMEIARLKMRLLKKEILLLNYVLSKEMAD